MRAGLPFTQLVEFASGFPDANVVWRLLDTSGTLLNTGAVTPPADSISTVIAISGADNTLSTGDLWGGRELNWTYTVGGLVESGSIRYRLEAFLPLGVSPAGVRTKLGVEPHELGDEEIDLVLAYEAVQNTVGADALAAVTGGYSELVMRDAIEATAALALLPTMPVRLAAKQSSGTDQFQRAAVDWAAVRDSLERLIDNGIAIVDTTIDPTAGYGAIFITIAQPDPITGADQ